MILFELLFSLSLDLTEQLVGGRLLFAGISTAYLISFPAWNGQPSASDCSTSRDVCNVLLSAVQSMTFPFENSPYESVFLQRKITGKCDFF